jgi:thiol-disulfide isomerase/thioredoxin
MIARGFTMRLLDSLEDNTKIYAIKLDLITTYTQADWPTYSPTLKLKEQPNDQYEITIDMDNNGVFDDSTRTLIGAQRLHIQYPIFSTTGKKLFDLPALLNIGHHLGKVEVIVKPLLKYNVTQHTISKIDSILYYPQFMLPRIVIKGCKAPSTPYQAINEPFKIGDTWYVFEAPNLGTKTIRLKTLDQQEKPYGYQEGHYVSLERLQALTKSTYEKEWSKAQYTLHHFWGPWCAPCLAELPKLQTLEKKLENSPITLLNHCFMFDRKKGDVAQYREELKRLIELGLASEKQQIMAVTASNTDDCTEDHPMRNKFTEACNTIEQFNVFIYPTYVLLDAEGKILYRGNAKTLQDDRFLHLINGLLEPQKIVEGR